MGGGHAKRRRMTTKAALLAKADLRRELRARVAQVYPRDGHGEARREAHSQAIRAALRGHPAWRKARMICAFLPLGSEPRIAPLWEEESEAAFCFPRPRGEELELVKISGPELLRRADWKMNLPELDTAPVLPLEAVDLLLVPGIAFALDGGRLGRGGGYYDRLLARKSPGTLAVGVCFGAQIVGDLPRELHDLRVDAIVTEQGALDLHNS